MKKLIRILFISVFCIDLSILCLAFAIAFLPFGIRQGKFEKYELLDNVKISDFLSDYPKKKNTFYVLRISGNEKEIVFRDFKEKQASEIYIPMGCIIDILKKYGFSELETVYYFYRADAGSQKWKFPEGEDEVRNAYVVMHSILYKNGTIVIHYY